MNNELTEDQFSAASDAMDARIRASRKDPDVKAATAIQSRQWEDAIALPQRTATERTERRRVIAETAAKLGLVAS